MTTLNEPPDQPSVNPGVQWPSYKMAVGYVATPTAPPDAHADRVVYGLMQPLLGARMLVADRVLLRAALLPAALLSLFCAAVALLDPVSWTLSGILLRFYQTFVVLAPLPSVLLAGYYARLAAVARNRFGFGPVEPCVEPLRRVISRMIKQTMLIAISLIPLAAALVLVPFLGPIMLSVVLAVWALHWIVVDAFDAARVLRPGQSLADLDALADQAPTPWFVRLLGKGERIPVIGGLFRRFAGFCDRLARPWREEVALIEQHPSLMIGFALATAALLATPVLNLLFRPIVLIGAAHVLGRLEHRAQALPPAPESPSASEPIDQASGMEIEPNKLG